ncbi:hypothetical protein PPL_12101 [Heterostelium album PN500]|uniref:Uncharacterized protein n=1 Tax=Heterostelium pallidum (strain ATCC 26659 / Pp 5 / PN500) TaxID=670386 RepID=D3BLP8_HETP5|nr:hypothetical protein PPL_12101 [Heterostelium album PN500]EFA77499.1 hypothetical protein PPL_12101 [Heterostelium album PN500]|eukprot:XP_020429627.1 hypothetical protein PPL_12101 [Heterostelium album PN500]
MSKVPKQPLEGITGSAGYSTMSDPGQYEQPAQYSRPQPIQYGQPQLGQYGPPQPCQYG